MEDANREETAQTPIVPAQLPPTKVYMTVGEMPKAFTHDVLLRAFTEYSVALGRAKDGKYSPLGTGVLVRRGKRFGILTAYHCLHSCSPPVRLGAEDGDELWLVLNRGRTVMVKPQEVIEHALAKPQSAEYGPDLCFIEILSIERLGTFKAYGTFWSLDRSPSDILQNFGTPLTPIASIGFPEVHYNPIKEGSLVRHQVRHMVYDNAIKEGDVFERWMGLHRQDNLVSGFSRLTDVVSRSQRRPCLGYGTPNRQARWPYQHRKTCLDRDHFLRDLQKGGRGRIAGTFH
jgi:hypothetical protein